MKYLNTSKLTDTQYVDLSDIVQSRLQIVDHDVIGEENFTWREFTIEELKEDADGVIYAPTAIATAYTFPADFTTEKGGNGSRWLDEEYQLVNYKPIYEVLINQ